MPSPKWKQFERDIAAWAKHNGKRLGGAPGKVEADVITDTATFECKSREDVPKWLLQAFDQSNLHKRLYPELENFVALGAHFGRGHQIRVFIAKEIILREDDFDRVSDAFKELLATLMKPSGEELDSGA